MIECSECYYSVLAHKTEPEAYICLWHDCPDDPVSCLQCPYVDNWDRPWDQLCLVAGIESSFICPMECVDD